MKLCLSGVDTIVVGEDADLLVLLVVTSWRTTASATYVPGKLHFCSEVRNRKTGKHACRNVPTPCTSLDTRLLDVLLPVAMHTVQGCDATNAIFNKGKGETLKLALADEAFDGCQKVCHKSASGVSDAKLSNATQRTDNQLSVREARQQNHRGRRRWRRRNGGRPRRDLKGWSTFLSETRRPRRRLC